VEVRSRENKGEKEMKETKEEKMEVETEREKDWDPLKTYNHKKNKI